MKKSLIGLVVSAALGVSGAANAYVVEASANLTNSCSFTSSGSGGRLVVDSTSGNKRIATNVTGGQSATFGIDYFGVMVVDIDWPTLTAKPAGQPDPDSTTASATDSQGNSYYLNISRNQGITKTYVSGSSVTVTVNLEATFTDSIKAGSYTLSSVTSCY